MIQLFFISTKIEIFSKKLIDKKLKMNNINKNKSHLRKCLRTPKNLLICTMKNCNKEKEEKNLKK